MHALVSYMLLETSHSDFSFVVMLLASWFSMVYLSVWGDRLKKMNTPNRGRGHLREFSRNLDYFNLVLSC
jgi:hypothetical protein